MKGERRSKFWEYAAGFFFLMGTAAALSRWGQGEDFYPVWLILLFFVLFFVAFAQHRKLTQELLKPLPVFTATPPDGKSSNSGMKKERYGSWDEDLRREREARELVARICEAKNIGLKLKQQGRSGHCEIPEIWTLEKAVPLTPDDLYALTADPVLKMETKVEDDGIIYAEKFSLSSNWVIYEQEKL